MRPRLNNFPNNNLGAPPAAAALLPVSATGLGLPRSLKGADAVILAVRHKQYLDLDPDALVKKIGRPAAIIDCFAILDDAKITRYFELGCEVKGLGRGHVNRIKKAVLGKKSKKR